MSFCSGVACVSATWRTICTLIVPEVFSSQTSVGKYLLKIFQSLMTLRYFFIALWINHKYVNLTCTDCLCVCYYYCYCCYCRCIRTMICSLCCFCSADMSCPVGGSIFASGCPTCEEPSCSASSSCPAARPPPEESSASATASWTTPTASTPTWRCASASRGMRWS
jgi:hypothetical protein